MEDKTKGAKLFVKIIKLDDDEHELVEVSEDKIVWFLLPVGYRNLRHHEVLLTKSTIKNAVSAIRPINGYRKVGINIDEDKRNVCFDEDDNISLIIFH